MGRGASRVRQGDVARAIRGAMIAGLSIAKVSVAADGTFEVIAGKPADPPSDQPAVEPNEWDAP
jgi:hypothetical protein